MRRWQAIVLWTLGASVLVAMMAFGYKGSQTTVLQGPHIQIDQEQNLHFVEEEDVLEIFRRFTDRDSLLRRSEINIELLEESIENHPAILEVEVYSNVHGNLYIDVYQERPIARIIRDNASYYLTEKGDSMPLSPKFSAEAPLISGALTAQRRAVVFEFLSELRQSPFYANFLSGLHLEADGKWILYPNHGQHRIEFGKPTNRGKKLKKLQAFYENAVDEEMIEVLERINVEYEGQVICAKRNTP